MRGYMGSQRSENTYHISDVIIHPEDPKIIFVSAQVLNMDLPKTEVFLKPSMEVIPGKKFYMLIKT